VSGGGPEVILERRRAQAGGVDEREEGVEVLEEPGAPVHQDDVAGPQPAGVGEAELMVAELGVPQHRRIHAAGADGLVGVLVFGAVGRAGQQRPATEGRQDEVGGLAQLGALGSEGEPRQGGVMHGVVFDGAAEGQDLAIEVRVAMGDGCDQERGDRCVVGLEERQHVREGVPAVVDGDEHDPIGGHDMVGARRDPRRRGRRGRGRNTRRGRTRRRGTPGAGRRRDAGVTAAGP